MINTQVEKIIIIDLYHGTAAGKIYEVRLEEGLVVCIVRAPSIYPELFDQLLDVFFDSVMSFD